VGLSAVFGSAAGYLLAGLYSSPVKVAGVAFALIGVGTAAHVAISREAILEQILESNRAAAEARSTRTRAATEREP
jgi:hypothetical protein